MKLNKGGAISLITILLGSIVIVHDFIKLISGYSYTVIGFISTIFILILMDEAIEYIKEREK